MSTATGVPAAAEAGGRGPASWPGRLATWPPWTATVLAVLAWTVALAAVEPLVRGYLTSVPDQRDGGPQRLPHGRPERAAGRAAIHRADRAAATAPPFYLPAGRRAVPRCRWRCCPGRPPSWPGCPSSTVPLPRWSSGSRSRRCWRAGSRSGCARPCSRSSSWPARTCVPLRDEMRSARWTWSCSRWPWRTARPARRGAGRGARWWGSRPRSSWCPGVHRVPVAVGTAPRRATVALGARPGRCGAWLLLPRDRSPTGRA